MSTFPTLPYNHIKADARKLRLSCQRFLYFHKKGLSLQTRRTNPRFSNGHLCIKKPSSLITQYSNPSNGTFPVYISTIILHIPPPTIPNPFSCAGNTISSPFHAIIDTGATIAAVQATNTSKVRPWVERGSPIVSRRSWVCNFIEVRTLGNVILPMLCASASANVDAHVRPGKMVPSKGVMRSTSI